MSAPSLAAGRLRPGASRRGTLVMAAGVVVVALGLAPLAVTVPLPVLTVALGAVGLVAVAYAHPPTAAYLTLGATPLLAGLARDAYIPLLRPHEAIGVLVGAGVVLRAVAQVAAGHRLPLRLTRIDVAFLLMATTSSALPLLWMLARGRAPATDDLLYAAAIWKFYGLFLLVRASVRTDRHVSRCLGVALAAGALVAVVAIMQALQVADLPRLLSTLYPTQDPGGITVGRGPATLGSSIAVGDVMAFDLAICLGWMVRVPASRRWLRPAVVLFTVGAFASGQFSAAIAVAVAVLAVALLTGTARRLLVVLVPSGVVAAVVLWPVISRRVADFTAPGRLPRSWQVRLDNLREIVWPELLSDHQWLLGVRPSARIRLDMPWGPYVYIESGHTWLLWTGGVPFAISFLYFMWVAVRQTARVGRDGVGAVGAAGIAGCASLLVVFVLMTFDPHITMRGTADLLFSLLALAVVVPAARHVTLPVHPPDRT
jgi:hypothetical protein